VRHDDYDDGDNVNDDKILIILITKSLIRPTLNMDEKLGHLDTDRGRNECAQKVSRIFVSKIHGPIKEEDR
jgi:hypothetical protein